MQECAQVACAALLGGLVDLGLGACLRSRASRPRGRRPPAAGTRAGSCSRARRRRTSTAWCSSWVTTPASIGSSPSPSSMIEGTPPLMRMPRIAPGAPKTTGLPFSSGIEAAARVLRSCSSPQASSLKTGQFCRISTKAVPLCCWARRRVSCMCEASTSIVRATKVAPAPSAKEMGSTGWSIEPPGVLFVFMPTSEVGEYWPLVRP